MNKAIQGSPESATVAPTPRTPRWLAIGVLILISAIWGLNFPITKIALQALTPMTLSTLRAVIASATLFAFLTSLGQRIALNRNEAWWVCLIGGSFACSNLGLIYGLTRVEAGLASLIQNTMPLFSVPVAWILIKERPTRNSLLGLAIGLAGVAMAAQINANASRGQSLAFLAVLAAPLFWAVTNTLIKRAALALHPAVLVGWMVLVTALIFAPVTLVADNATHVWNKLAMNWHSGIPFAVIYMGTGVIALGFAMNAWLLQRSTTLFVSTSAYLIPVFGTLGGVMMLGEGLSVNFVLGAVVVFLGVTIVLFTDDPNSADTAFTVGRHSE